MIMIDFYRIRIGDRIVRTKGGIFSKHHLIYAGFWNGQHLVAENQVGYGVRYANLQEVMNGGNLVRVEYNNFDTSSQNEIIRRINLRLGTQYSLFEYNCEHFVNEVLTGIRKSHQVNTALIIGFGALLCYALKK